MVADEHSDECYRMLASECAFYHLFVELVLHCHRVVSTRTTRWQHLDDLRDLP